MRKLLSFFLLFSSLQTASAQTGCGPVWLQQQSNNSLSKAPWEDYTGPRVRELYLENYFVLQSDVDHNVKMNLDGGRHYTMLLYTGSQAMASGFELRDATGLRLEFEKVYGKAENNWLELTYESTRSGTYNAVVRCIFPSERSSCTVLLVREWDDVEWRERSRDQNSSN